jgi:transcriptional regulator with XRE-family HTH domain
VIPDGELSADQSASVTLRIREVLARRRISRQRLADEARISLSTLEKALAGARPFTLATLIRLEQALGQPLRPSETPAGLAPTDLGAYSHAAVTWLEGDYLTLRPSFERAEAIYAYRTQIAWSDEASCLTFHEAARQDTAFTQTGQVSLPNQSGHVYLRTNDRGQMRLITLGRPTIAGEMFGLLSTLQSGRGGHLSPIGAPIALIPLHRAADARFGQVAPAETHYPAYHAWLERAEKEGFVRLTGVA